MSWGFERGRVYNRRRDIHARFRGQQQGGIITPAGFPLVIIITGEEGHDHGYADRWRPDGVFEYFGEGQEGPMKWKGGNNAIRDHLLEGESLLLFRKTKAGLQFEGEMTCEGFHYEEAPDTKHNMRQAIVFELRDSEAVAEQTDALAQQTHGDLNELRRRAFDAAKNAGPGRSAPRTIYDRSKDVRDYVLARTGENCEGCERPAEFRRPNGAPYFEPHHLRKVSDGGPDHPRHVIGLCPTCHRRVHFGADGQTYNATLIEKMTTIEPPMWV
ncbi:HNH endonuclease signature motif containing protein [Mesorhizobium amorphae]|uniref:HNH endonuclease n=1 Tax=Mesorhizobium amorphae TaxID=71433 RepID=UPI0021B3ECFE|nr:HNH endonuclease signature motif containing protein [Mesorhizobium amorphae]